MQRYKVFHQTDYSFSALVDLYPHTLRLRPREGHELRVESSSLEISPEATVRWHRDVEGNSVATATFSQRARELSIRSEVVIQQYNQVPFDFLVADYAVAFPFSYSDEEHVMLAPYMNTAPHGDGGRVTAWVREFMEEKKRNDTLALLLDLNSCINRLMSYQIREQEGVQSAAQTLESGSGSCRDAANLFMVATRRLGFASRFVSGYLHAQADQGEPDLAGSTHAWAEVFIPGAGWKGFDPTVGIIAGAEHIAVAVARLPEAVPPVAGTFHGTADANLKVAVRVTALPQ